MLWIYDNMNVHISAVCLQCACVNSVPKHKAISRCCGSLCVCFLKVHQAEETVQIDSGLAYPSSRTPVLWPTCSFRIWHFSISLMIIYILEKMLLHIIFRLHLCQIEFEKEKTATPENNPKELERRFSSR